MINSGFKAGSQFLCALQILCCCPEIFFARTLTRGKISSWQTASTKTVAIATARMSLIFIEVKNEIEPMFKTQKPLVHAETEQVWSVFLCSKMCAPFALNPSVTVLLYYDFFEYSSICLVLVSFDSS